MSKITSFSPDNQTISSFSVPAVTQAGDIGTGKLFQTTKLKPNLQKANSVMALKTKAKTEVDSPRREWKRGCYERVGKLAAVNEVYLASKLGQPLNTVRQDLFLYLLRNREQLLEGLRLRLQLRLQLQSQAQAQLSENRGEAQGQEQGQAGSFDFLTALVYELPFDYTPLPIASLREAVARCVWRSDKFLLPVLVPVLPTSKTSEVLTKPHLRVAVRQIAGTTILDELSEILSKTCVLLPAQNLAAFLAQSKAQAGQTEPPELELSPKAVQSEEKEKDEHEDNGEREQVQFATTTPLPLSPGSYRPLVIEQLQNKNLSLQKTAQLLNISYRSVCRLRKRGEPKYRSVSDCQIFYALLERNLNYEELVERLGVSRRTISKSFTRVMNKLVESLVQQAQL